MGRAPHPVKTDRGNVMGTQYSKNNARISGQRSTWKTTRNKTMNDFKGTRWPMRRELGQHVRNLETDWSKSGSHRIALGAYKTNVRDQQRPARHHERIGNSSDDWTLSDSARSYPHVHLRYIPEVTALCMWGSAVDSPNPTRWCCAQFWESV